MKTALLITAGGKSQRFGENKLLVPIQGVSLIAQTLLCFKPFSWDEVVMTYAPETLSELQEAVRCVEWPEIRWVPGGASRFESVKCGVMALSSEVSSVFIHDAARPYVSKTLVERLRAAAHSHRAVIPGLPIVETVKDVKNGYVQKTVDRSPLMRIQTPQVCHVADLKAAYQTVDATIDYTDESMVLEMAGFPVYVVPGDPQNIKITTPEDLI